MEEDTKPVGNVAYYVELLDILSDHIGLTENKKTIIDILRSEKRVIQERFSVTFNVTDEGKVLLEGDPGPAAKTFFFNLYLNALKPIEEKYGVIDIWKRIGKLNLELYINNLGDIQKKKIEMPLMKYEMDFLVKGGGKGGKLDSLFGRIKNDAWVLGLILVTNLGLYIKLPKREIIVPLHQIISVGRELYVDDDIKYGGRVVRVIDYHEGKGQSSVFYNTREGILRNFNDLITTLREAKKELSDLERDVLSTLARGRPISTLLSLKGLQPDDIADALKRLRELGYIDGNYKPTSLGINASAEKTIGGAVSEIL